jgi:ribosomal-protein-alanine N-acetyltransferase
MTHICFTPFPTLITERLTLRQMTMEDENEVFALRADPSVSAFIGRPLARSIEEARRFIEKINEGLAKNESAYWAITLKSENKLIGTICLWNIVAEEAKAEIGYELTPPYQGKGIMQEAFTAVVRYGFERMKLETIEALPSPKNARSIRLLERNQFVRTGSLRDDGFEMLIYTLKNIE